MSLESVNLVLGPTSTTECYFLICKSQIIIGILQTYCEVKMSQV